MAASTPPGAVPPDTPSTILPGIPTPTYGPGGSFSVACSTRIAASPAVCAETILQHGSYPSWNRFVRAMTVDSPNPAPSAPGTAAPDAPVFTQGGPDYLATGVDITLHVHLDALREDSSERLTPITVCAVERLHGDGREGWSVAWKPRGMPYYMLRSERVQEFVEAPGGETEYICWETFYGLLAPVVKFMVGRQLITGFGVWMEDLKKEAERRAKEAA
ncbi:hypothetical protein GQ53DRAFT_751024 [Thozetella sp. PMI_491]|nr:hypothetical protein GQ53DRAFT_751024 [Thozetella sp. PMI_491]